MKSLMSGLAAFAAAQAFSACAQATDADLWISIDTSENGFLLDEQTGNVWMTGSCLKPLEQASQIDGAWVSRTVELVSVGRAMALLDQTFTFDIEGDRAMITVLSEGRGGAQPIEAAVYRDCSGAGQCARLISTQAICQG